MPLMEERLRVICSEHRLRPECLEDLLKCEEDKKRLIRKRGLKQDILRILKQEVSREEDGL